jgi:hypothetical protein
MQTEGLVALQLAAERVASFHCNIVQQTPRYHLHLEMQPQVLDEELLEMLPAA